MSRRAGESRRGLVADLERRRRPSQAAMEEAGRELGREREGSGAQPEIALPQEEGHPHGQLVVAFNPATGQGWGFNFVEHPWAGDESIRSMAERLASFLDDPELPYLEFVSPHDGRIHCLTREGARRVIAVDHARTQGEVAPHSDQVKLVRVQPGMLPPGMRRG